MDGFVSTQLLYVASELGVGRGARGRPAHRRRGRRRRSAPTPARSRASCAGSRSRTWSSEDDGRFALTPLGEQLEPHGRRAARPRRGLLPRRGGPARGGRARRDGVRARARRAVLRPPRRPSRPTRRAFQASMAGRSEQEAGDVVAAYDFSGLGEPGRRGRRPRRPARGDPRRRAAHQGHARRPCGRGRGRREHLGARAECVEGDFFDAASGGRGRLPALARPARLGRRGRAAASSPSAVPRCRAHGRLLVVDAILPERAKDGPLAIRMDLHMLLLLGARERTEAEFRALLAERRLRGPACRPDALARGAERDRGGATAP